MALCGGLVTLARPDRGPKRAELDTLIGRFAAAGLQPVVSTNGSIPNADIQVAQVPAKEAGGPDRWKIEDVWITAHGRTRLNVRAESGMV